MSIDRYENIRALREQIAFVKNHVLRAGYGPGVAGESGKNELIADLESKIAVQEAALRIRSELKPQG